MFLIIALGYNTINNTGERKTSLCKHRRIKGEAPIKWGCSDHYVL